MSDKGSESFFAAIRRQPIYPAVFCLAFPLSIFNLHSDYYSWHGLLPGSALLLCIGGAALLLLRRVVPDRQLRGLVTLVLLIALFPRSVLTVPAFSALAVAGIAWATLRLFRRSDNDRGTSPRLPAKFSYIANLVAIAVAVALAGRSMHDAFNASMEARDITANRIASFREAVPASTPGNLPHIVHIVLDGYSRADVLQSVYGYDNTSFLNALRTRGFRVAERATTPFNQTLLTMSSIFSLAPVVEAADFGHPWGDAAHYRRTLGEIIRDGTVPQILAEQGYEIRSAPVAFVGLQRENPATTAGELSPFGLFGFAATYSFTYELLVQSPVLNSLAVRFLGDHFDVIAVNYRYLKNLPERRFQPPEQRPLFLYQHVLAPHPPFNITPDGERRPLGILPRALVDSSHLIQRSEARRAEYRRGYLDKLSYVNGAVLRQIDNLQASLTGPLIILLHGDHGGGLHTEQEDKTKTCLRERFSPLLAVYATDRELLAQIGDEFDIVNLYRAVFRVTLGADLPDLAPVSTFVAGQFGAAAKVEAEEMSDPCPAAPGVPDPRDPSIESAAHRH